MEEQPKETKTTAVPASRKMLIIVSIFNVFIMLTSLFVYDHYFAQKVVVLDVNKYIADLKDLYISGKITDAELNEAPKKVKAAADSVGKNTIILVGEAVLKNGKQIQIKD